MSLVLVILAFQVSKLKNFFGSMLFALIETFINLLTFFPLYPLLLIVFSTFKPNIILFEGIIGIFVIPALYRLFYGHLVVLEAQDYVQYQRVIGQTKIKTYLNVILPALFYELKPALGQIAIQTLVLESIVGYIGIGVPDRYIGWGTQVSLDNFTVGKSWASILPAIGIIFTACAFQIVSTTQQKISWLHSTFWVAGWSKR